ARSEGQAGRLCHAGADTQCQRGGPHGVRRKIGVQGLRERGIAESGQGPLKGILGYTEEELVSADFEGNSHSSIVDAHYTKVVGDKCVKVLAWYDNEWGYSCRCRDLIKFLASKF